VFRSRRRKRITIATIALILVVGGVTIAFGPVVRSRVASEAAKRGIVVTVGRVSPGWFAVTLTDVTVKPEGATGLEAHIDSMRVETSGTLSVERVVARGAHIAAEDDAIAELSAWRLRHPSTSEGGVSKTALSVEGASLTWTHVNGDAEATLEALGMAATRNAAGTQVSTESVVMTRKRARIALGVTNVSVEAGKLHDAHIDSARVALELEPVESSPPPDPVPVPTPHKRGKSAEPPEPFHPLVALPDLHLLRAMIRSLGQRAGDRAPEGMHVALDALTIELTRGSEKLELGPGKVSVERNTRDVTVDFSAGSDKTQTPLTLVATIPLDAGDTIIALAGGPVTLSMLGVREGAFGFVDPGRTNVRGKARLLLDDAGGAVTFDGELGVNGLSLKNTRVADEVVRGLDVRVSARGVLDDAGAVRLDDAEAQLGALHLHAHGGLEQTADHLSARLSLDLAVAGCQSLLDSIPAALLPHVSLTHYRGTLGGTGYLSFDTRKIDDLVIKYDFDDLCRATAVPDELRKDHFDGTFTYAVIDKDGKPAERESGPGSTDWAPLDTISPMMQVAVLTTEDGAFFHHHGFNTWAIRSSIIANLKAGRFVRGASTITMQLAKNLFLSRQKTLSRKLEEVILADYLERTFHKGELMELYLNVIEFGPDIYGVRAAAEHYFARTPAELNLAESLFLSSLLPRPLEYHKMMDKGEVPPSWMNNIHQLMDVAHKNARISDKELEEAKSETIILHRPDAPPPQPRTPVTASHFTGDDTWETN